MERFQEIERKFEKKIRHKNNENLQRSCKSFPNVLKKIENIGNFSENSEET